MGSKRVPHRSARLPIPVASCLGRSFDKINSRRCRGVASFVVFQISDAVNISPRFICHAAVR